MISQKELKYLLGEIQGLQKENFGKVSVTIDTWLYDFSVIIKGRGKFDFTHNMTSDECIDNFHKVRNVINNYEQET